MDRIHHLHREIQAFEAAARRAADAPLVPSCPGWSLSDLVLHLGGVHRYVAHIIANRAVEQPDPANLVYLGLPEDLEGWPDPQQAPNLGVVPKSLLDWFAEGAGSLEALFAATDLDEPVWTWSSEQSVGFWLRMQTIEAALHRWDAELGALQTLDAELAADVVAQTFEVMAPARRAWTQAPPGSGERFLIRQGDGPGLWSVRFDGAEVLLSEGVEPSDVELTGTASQLALFLWHRIPADRLEVRGDQQVLDRYFTLVPPV